MKNLLLVALVLVSPAFGEEVAVRIETNNGFHPRVVEIKVGDVVEWFNPSQMTHTVTADPALAKDPKNVVLPEGAVPFNSGPIRPGATFRKTFSVPGNYRYTCIPHEKFGMIGEIVVH